MVALIRLRVGLAGAWRDVINLDGVRNHRGVLCAALHPKGATEQAVKRCALRNIGKRWWRWTAKHVGTNANEGIV